MVHVIVIALLSHVVCLQGSGDLKNSAKHGDYIGCYDRGCLRFYYGVNPTPDVIVTPSTCTEACQENGFPLAGVYNRSKCSCLCQQTCRTKPLPDRNCGVPCQGDSGMFCGSFISVSLYTVYTNSSNEVCSILEEVPTVSLEEMSSEETRSSIDLVIPISIPVACVCFFVIIAVILIRLRLRRGRRDSTEVPQSTTLQNKDQHAGPLKHYQGSNQPSTTADLPIPPDAYVLNPTPQDASGSQLNHDYAEADADHPRPVPKTPDVHTPHSESSYTSISAEYHEYTYAKPIKSKSKITDGGGSTDEDGYITPVVPSPTPPPPQMVYYSSRVPKQESVTRDKPSSAPPTQGVYYSSRVPRDCNKNEGQSAQDTSKVVYYSSRLNKPGGS